MRTDLISLFGRKPAPKLDHYQLPEILSRYLELVTANTDARPGLLLTAFLPFCAVNLGNRAHMVSNSTRVYPNIWSCVVGPSSVSRKSTALRFAGYTLKPHEEALLDAPLDQFEQETLVLNGTTLSKLISYLAENPARLFVHNELATWLSDMQKNYNGGYRESVTGIFDNIDLVFANRERTERLRCPALSVAAASTEGWLYQNMARDADQLSGFLQRMLFYVVGNVSLAEIDLSTRIGEGLEEDLALFDARWFCHWRRIPPGNRLRLSEESIEWRDALYQTEYKKHFGRANDALMSYFTRIFDGYFFKFCALIALSLVTPPEWRAAEATGDYDSLFAAHAVDTDTASMAWSLCVFYMENVSPLLAMMEEKDKLAGERKVVEALLNKFGGKAKHSELMNSCHMRKREFSEVIASLIDREAVTVESYGQYRHVGKMYILSQEIIDSW
ncbi:MAG: hypothetical protein ACP5F3_07120, partial [Candidatus Syntrophosphaera sp.]